VLQRDELARVALSAAYLGHYAEPLLLGQSHSTRACG
jgi:hypothetical protein